jgi:DNA-binding NtrC family response regulator
VSERPRTDFADRTEPLAAARPPKPIGVVVRVVGAPAEPASFRLGDGTCVVGSAPNCDIVVTDKAVSRTHVELAIAPEGVSVKDLGSRNGTFFHGQKVERMVLGLGGRLEVGSATVAIEADTEALLEAPGIGAGSYRGIVGESAPMRQLFAVLLRLEGSLATVLVEGESGVGKERVAQALHDGSAVADGSFVAVNCGALPRELVASELFGHRRGAFSGAFDARRGAFDSADGGTLFLDEIGELPLEVQPMLLRALDLGEVRPLGDDQPRRVKVRVVAATNRDLEADVKSGRFRHDLFYRLAVVRLRVPPLRERPDDVAPLALAFARAAGLGGLAPELITDLARRSWPGNARELRNAVVAFAALGALPPGGAAPPTSSLAGAVTPFVDVARPFADQKEALVDAFQKSYLAALLEHTGGNQSEAARIAGMNRNYLARLLQKYGLR